MATTTSGRRFALLLAEDHIDGDHFVGAARRQAVGAGQVDQVEGLAGTGHLPFLGLDGDAGIVADALTQAGQGVEEGGLAGIGIADQSSGRSMERWHNLLSWHFLPSPRYTGGEGRSGHGTLRVQNPLTGQPLFARYRAEGLGSRQRFDVDAGRLDAAKA